VVRSIGALEDAAPDAGTTVFVGNPTELAHQYRELKATLPNLTVLGGCCGTDLRHVTAICEAFSR